MKRAFLLLVATILAACSSSPAEGPVVASPNLLFGTWTSESIVVRPSDGLKIINDYNLSFREDRTCRIGHVQIMGGTSTTCEGCYWQLVDNKLTITNATTFVATTMEIDFKDADFLMFVPTNTLYKRTKFSDGYTCK